MQVTMSMMRKEFITGMMDCDSAEMICGTQARGGHRLVRRGKVERELPNRKSRGDFFALELEALLLP
jgi:hypothetical protein